MKLIKPSFEIIEQPSGLEGMYKQIELVGRVSHKSEDRITEDSSKEFVDRMIKLGHGAVLEHGTVYLKIAYKDIDFVTLSVFYGHNKYSKITHSKDDKIHYITTNYRVLVENNHLRDLKYLCEPTEFHEKRVCVKFICDRGILAEFTRHRTFSFSAESTRYCNYSKNKFNNELTFIKPCWLDIPTGQYVYWDGDWCDIDNMKIQLPEGEHKDINAFLWTLNNIQTHYTLLINRGWKPQEARSILPNALKTELVMTGFISDWRNFFKLRSNTYGKWGAHPQADELATPLYEEFIKRKYIK